MSTIGQLRRERGLTQDELARRVRVSTRSVAAWESGSASPRLRHLRALARALNVPVEQLLPPEPAGQEHEQAG